MGNSAVGVADVAFEEGLAGSGREGGGEGGVNGTHRSSQLSALSSQLSTLSLSLRAQRSNLAFATVQACYHGRCSRLPPRSLRSRGRWRSPKNGSLAMTSIGDLADR